MFSCSKKMYPDTAEAKIIGGNDSGIVTITAYGYAPIVKEAELDAIRTAFQNLFYIGFPDNGYVSNLKTPFFDREPNEESDFFKTFYSSKKYLTYITNQSKAVEVKNKTSPRLIEAKGILCVKKELTINYKALRKYLEDQNVLRKGFSY